jgi:hypothetical protein
MIAFTTPSPSFTDMVMAMVATDTMLMIDRC